MYGVLELLRTEGALSLYLLMKVSTLGNSPHSNLLEGGLVLNEEFTAGVPVVLGVGAVLYVGLLQALQGVDDCEQLGQVVNLFSLQV